MNIFRTRLYTLISLAIVIPLGLYANTHRGAGSIWLNNSSAGLLYELFWCLFFFLVFIKAKPYRIVLWVFIGTTALEVLQLWHPAFLVPIRSTFFGKAMLGSSFSFIDILYYLFGCILGWLWLIGIKYFGMNK
ncbi:MAG: DUF2809 domain-containing protein [Bacteroidales bacterium]|nr:DUF2809 domain-containing protein [Bacteroidales bacterium]